MTADDPDIILDVVFYKTSRGKEPVRDWLKGMAKEDRRTIGEDIKTVQFGWSLGMPLVRKIEPRLWEVRSRISTGIARVVFTVEDDDMVLLHGFVKKSQKLPEVELKTARSRLAHLEREDDDERQEE